MTFTDATQAREYLVEMAATEVGRLTLRRLGWDVVAAYPANGGDRSTHVVAEILSRELRNSRVLV